MKFREYEAKQIFRDAGIPTPNSELIVSAEEAAEALSRVAEKVVLKAQVDVGGRGKAGGILPATAETVDATAKELFGCCSNSCLRGAQFPSSCRWHPRYKDELHRRDIQSRSYR